MARFMGYDFDSKPSDRYLDPLYTDRTVLFMGSPTGSFILVTNCPHFRYISAVISAIENATDFRYGSPSYKGWEHNVMLEESQIEQAEYYDGDGLCHG